MAGPLHAALLVCVCVCMCTHTAAKEAAGCVSHIAGGLKPPASGSMYNPFQCFIAQRDFTALQTSLCTCHTPLSTCQAGSRPTKRQTASALSMWACVTLGTQGVWRNPLLWNRTPLRTMQKTPG